ncbi:MAG: hypothetical protein LBF22_14920 [Deltaproteobacteria bacterium]|jgi:hypothetical protein|nr:hypothetical protein [Deltaproteobacteria bacterium]
MSILIYSCPRFGKFSLLLLASAIILVLGFWGLVLSYKACPKPYPYPSWEELDNASTALTRGKASLISVFNISEGMTLFFLKLNKQTPEDFSPPQELSAFWLSDGTITLGPVFIKRGVSMAKKHDLSFIIHNFTRFHGWTIGKKRHETGYYEMDTPLYGNSEEHMYRILEQRVFIFFDPTCEYALKLFLGGIPQTLETFDKQPVLVPIAFNSGSLPYAEYFMDRGKFASEEADIFFEKQFYSYFGVKQEAELAISPVPPEELWEGPSRVMENTWRARTFLNEGQLLASPTFMWLDNAQLQVYRGVPDSDVLEAIVFSKPSKASLNTLLRAEEKEELRVVNSKLSLLEVKKPLVIKPNSPDFQESPESNEANEANEAVEEEKENIPRKTCNRSVQGQRDPF